jgi:hypothetical protein
MWSCAAQSRPIGRVSSAQLHITDNFTFVNDQQRGLGEGFQFPHERMIDLRSQQMIQHVHGGGEDDALIGLACLPSEDAGEEGLAHTRIADQHQVGALFQEGKVEQTEDAILRLHAALVVVEVEGVDAGLRLQTRAPEAALDGAAVTRFQLHVGKQFEGGRDAEISGCRVSDRRLRLAAHRFQIQLL